MGGCRGIRFWFLLLHLAFLSLALRPHIHSQGLLWPASRAAGDCRIAFQHSHTPLRATIPAFATLRVFLGARHIRLKYAERACALYQRQSGPILKILRPHPYFDMPWTIQGLCSLPCAHEWSCALGPSVLSWTNARLRSTLVLRAKRGDRGDEEGDWSDDEQGQSSPPPESTGMGNILLPDGVTPEAFFGDEEDPEWIFAGPVSLLWRLYSLSFASEAI